MKSKKPYLRTKEIVFNKMCKMHLHYFLDFFALCNFKKLKHFTSKN